MPETLLRTKLFAPPLRPNLVALSPDGKRLAVGAVSGIFVFTLPIEEVVELAESQLTRSLTGEECQQYLHILPCPDSS